MRKPYESPDIALLGSVADLTQATVLGPGTDALSFIPLVGGDDPFS